MKFDEWWTDKRDKHGKEYVMLGPFALRNIAKLAYEEGYKQGTLDGLDKSIEIITHQVKNRVQQHQ